MPITARVNASIQFTQTKTPDGGQARAELAVSLAALLGDGTADNQANIGFIDQRTLATAANEDIDLAGVLTDAFGTVIANAEVAAFLIKAAAANTTALTVKPAAATSFLGPFGANTHTIQIKPGGCFMWFAPAGYAVVGGASDLINVANAAGASAVYDIAVIGRSS